MTASHEHTVPTLGTSPQTRLDFGNAPVAETSLGFYFQKLDGWNVLHHGSLWERFRSAYPAYEFLPPVVDVPPQLNSLLDFNAFPFRAAFVDKTRGQLVQMQNGLLLHNWRKTDDAPEYQRYEVVKAWLRSDWDTLRSYLREGAFKEPVVTRCQMDYFNNLVRGDDWQDFSNLPNIFTPWRGLPQSATEGTVQMVSFSVLYQFESGNVNVAVQPAIRRTDGKEILQFTLSSSVIPKNSEDKELFICLDECHNNAARAFLYFTTDKAREKWEQRK